jgi:glyoxylase-like metal-dependent hydrolase (beta-lactamase superfamily II)
MSPRARTLVPRLLIALQVVAILVAAGILVAVWSIRRLPKESLAPDLFVFEGRGANTVVLTTSEGALVVDPKFWRFGGWLRRAVDALSEKPVRYVVNTHYHWDHTRGNVDFPVDATYVSTRRTLEHMIKLEPDFWGSDRAKAVMPTETSEEIDHRIKLGDQLIHVVQVGRGHTDGDCVVYFPSQGVVATGDLFFNGYYPIVDHKAGGSILEWIGTLDRVLALGPTRVVPGHGAVTEPAEVKAFQGYFRDLVTEVAKLKDAGKSRDEVVKTLHLPIHEARMKNLYSYSSLAQNAGDAYDELANGGKLPERVAAGAEGSGVEAADGEPDEVNNDEKGEAASAPGSAVGAPSAGSSAASTQPVASTPSAAAPAAVSAPAAESAPAAASALPAGD